MTIMYKMNNKQSGLTLIELLLAISIISMLMTIVIIAVNPSKQFSAAKNAVRWSAVNAIANAVYQYALDHKGTLPPGITSSSTEICSNHGSCNNYVDLSVFVPQYLAAIPVDPAVTSGAGSGYYIATSSGRHIVVDAPHADTGGSVLLAQ